MAHQPPAPLALPDGRPLHVAADQLRDGEGLALPPVFSFAAVIGGASKTYYHDRFDEAMRHSRENALAMRRDCFLMSLLQERKMAVSSLPWYLETPDPKDRRQAKVRAVLTQCLRGTRGLRRMILAWLESIWYGRYGVQFSWRWGQADGRKVLAVDRWAPVNGDKIGYHWDGTPYVLVNAARAGSLPGVVLTNTTRARALSLVGGWRDRFVVHMHDIDDADFFEAEAAAGRHGVGVRSRVYWLDFLKREYLDWVVTYLERVGLGTTLWKYDASSPEQKSAAESAARDNSRRVNITVPVWPDRSGGYAGGVERIEAPMGGVEALRTMIEAMDQYIERYIIGQSGSSQSQSSGLGNEAASEFMSSTKDAIRDHDAHLLAETITGSEGEPGLLSLMQRYSFPETMPENSDGFPVLFKFGLEKSLNNQRIQTIGQVSQMGLPVRKDDIYNAAGLSRPEDHDDVLEPQQQGGPPGAGGDPLAALMGGGGPPGGDVPPDGPDGGDDAPASEEDVDSFLSELFGEDGSGGGEPEEDRASEEDVDGFLAELLGGGEDDEQTRQMARQGRGVEQYGWEKGRATADGRFRWKGTEDHKGQYRTQKTEPGSRASKSAESKPASKKKSKADPERARGALTRLKAEGDSPEIRDELWQALDGLTVPQLDELRREFGVRGGGKRKADKQESLAGHKPGEVPAKKLATPAVAPKAKKAPLAKPLRQSEKDLEAIQRIEDVDAFDAAVAGMSDSQLRDVLAESMNGMDVSLLRKLSRGSLELLLSPERGAAKRKAKDEATHSKILDVIKEDGQSADLVKKIAGLAGARVADPKQVAKEHKKKVTEARNKLRDAVGPKDIAAARAEYEKLAKGGNAASLAAVRKTRDAARAALMEAIKDKTPGKIDITYESGGLKIQKNATKAVEWLSAIAGAADVKVVIKVGPPGTRAVANTKGGVNYVTVAASDSDATIVHEICHHIEKQPGVQRALQQYLGHRCKGERPQRLNEVGLRGYSNSEKGRKDDFAKVFGEKNAWYVGKSYASGQSELLSMSVQKLYEDPVAMAESDPELTQFIIGVLQGRIKGNA